MKKSLFKSMSAALVGLTSVACQSANVSANGPAVLERADASTMSVVRAAIAEMMGVATVELGAGDPTQAPVIAVLPPAPTSFETRSIVKPRLFDIRLDAGRCVLIDRETGAQATLNRISCRVVRQN